VTLDPRILVVDDEHAIVRSLSAALHARGYRVDAARTGSEALDRAASTAPDLIVLDLGLPDLDGIEVCRQIRAWSDVPIIVLTAEGADDVKVRALDEGADDYVTKPFSTPELLARIRVALRHRSRTVDRGMDEAELHVGDLVVDIPHHEVRVRGELVELTPKEFGFLATLARHPGRVLTHRMILQEVWGEGYGTETQYLRVYAAQLRKKLAGRGAPDLVTEPGVGYRLVDPEASDR
jgi:two-component system KDP operon response regulator KdpE